MKQVKKRTQTGLCHKRMVHARQNVPLAQRVLVQHRHTPVHRRAQYSVLGKAHVTKHRARAVIC